MSDWQTAATVAEFCLGAIGAVGAYLQSREAKSQRKRANDLINCLNEEMRKSFNDRRNHKIIVAAFESKIRALEAGQHRYRDRHGRWAKKPAEI